jgi:hypothetical protein
LVFAHRASALAGGEHPPYTLRITVNQPGAGQSGASADQFIVIRQVCRHGVLRKAMSTTQTKQAKRMGRPPKPEAERLDVVAIRVNAELSERIAAAAAQLGVGRTTAARMLIEAALEARAAGHRRARQR